MTGSRPRLFLATPLAERGREAEVLYREARDLLQAGIGGFLVRSFEGLAHMVRLGLSYACIVDAPVYTWNQEARLLLRELGFAGDVAPYELSKAQLRDRQACRLRGFAPSESEVQIYGRQVLMVTAQCLRKNYAVCTKTPGLETLVDRTGTAFPVRCNCTFCSNIIYNSVPHSLFREAGFFQKAGFTSLRLAFTVESPKETAKLVAFAKKVLTGANAPSKGGSGAFANTGGNPAGEPVPKYTKGQFSRGVE